MTCLKIVGISVIAAIAITASIGVGSASAVTTCKENTSPCPAAKTYPAGTFFWAKLLTGKEAKFTGTLTAQCTSSGPKEKLTAESANPLPGELLELTFGGCSGCTTVASEGVPYSTEIVTTAGGNGTLTLNKIKIKLSGCALGTTCTATAKAASLAFTGAVGGNEANDPMITANNVPLEVSGIGCGTASTFNASYYVEKAQEPGQAAVANPPAFVE
jgi:hypothetical protein